jgi:mannose-6-phosphate isomerase-like protein (cupin superfamily)
VIDKYHAEHYNWGENCDGWHLVKSDVLSVIQELMPPHTAEVRHFHSRSRQFFFVLSGEATIEVDGTRHTLNTQQGLEIPPGVAHQVCNDSEAELSFLVVSCPPSHGDRINEDKR